MSDTLVSPPKFRTTTRLVQWVRRNRFLSRVPPDSERCFFRTKETPEKVSSNVVAYAVWAGPLGAELEGLLSEADALVYARERCRKGVMPSDLVLDRVKERDLAHFSQYYCPRYGRLPERLERKIQDPAMLADYAGRVGALPPHLEEVILRDGTAAMQYIEILCYHNKEISERHLRALIGCDRHFVKLAGILKRRLPDYLEASISDPQVALNYARNVVLGRLPEEVEQRVFLESPRWAAKYAFDVIRGFASVRLPGFLHNAVVLHGGGDLEIQRYIQEDRRLSEKLEPQG